MQEFPDFQTFMEHMPSNHDKDPCYGAFNLYEYAFGGGNTNDALNDYARKWETSPKKILQHMNCVDEFLETKYPTILSMLHTIEKSSDRTNCEDEPL